MNTNSTIVMMHCYRDMQNRTEGLPTIAQLNNIAGNVQPSKSRLLSKPTTLKLQPKSNSKPKRKPPKAATKPNLPFKPKPHRRLPAVQSRRAVPAPRNATKKYKEHVQTVQRSDKSMAKKIEYIFGQIIFSTPASLEFQKDISTIYFISILETLSGLLQK